MFFIRFCVCVKVHINIEVFYCTPGSEVSFAGGEFSSKFLKAYLPCTFCKFATKQIARSETTSFKFMYVFTQTIFGVFQIYTRSVLISSCVQPQTSHLSTFIATVLLVF